MSKTFFCRANFPGIIDKVLENGHLRMAVFLRAKKKEFLNLTAEPEKL